jgi:hypothetical protein
MTSYQKMVTAIRRDLDPKFKIREKDSALVGRIHSWFAPHAAVILGHTCYVPEEVFDSVSVMAQLMAHEGTHVAQRRDLGAIAFNYKYAYPWSLGAILFLLGLIVVFLGVLFENVITLATAMFLFFASIAYISNTRLAKARAILELEALSTSWWYFYGEDELQNEFLVRSWISGVRQAINNPVYLGCGLSIENTLISKVLFSAVKGNPAKCGGYNRFHTMKWLLTARQILLDAGVKRV